MMHCPSCNVNLDGELIYETFLRQYKNEEKALEAAANYGATKTEGRWSRQLALTDIGKDHVTHYVCPDCDHKWRLR